MTILDKIIVGNIAVQAKSLRRFLKKSHYWLKYDPKLETAGLWANHNAGGELLLELRGCSYESAARLAAELGLEPDAGRDQPLTWSKWNPIVTLHDDGSEAILDLVRACNGLNLPFVTRRARECGISSGGGLYTLGLFHLDRLIDQLKEWAELYKEQLGSEP